MNIRYIYIVNIAKMIETTHKYKDDRVILRFDENEKDWRKNSRTEYRTGREWKS